MAACGSARWSRNSDLAADRRVREHYPVLSAAHSSPAPPANCATRRRPAAICCSGRAAAISTTPQAVQQARARLGLRRARGHQPHPRHPRRQRSLHRHASVGHGRRADGAGRRGRDGSADGRARANADFRVLPAARRYAGDRDRAAAGRADHRSRSCRRRRRAARPIARSATARPTPSRWSRWRVAGGRRSALGGVAHKPWRARGRGGARSGADAAGGGRGRTCAPAPAAMAATMQDPAGRRMIVRTMAQREGGTPWLTSRRLCAQHARRGHAGRARHARYRVSTGRSRSPAARRYAYEYAGQGKAAYGGHRRRGDRDGPDRLDRRVGGRAPAGRAPGDDATQRAEAGGLSTLRQGEVAVRHLQRPGHSVRRQGPLSMASRSRWSSPKVSRRARRGRARQGELRRRARRRRADQAPVAAGLSRRRRCAASSRPTRRSAISTPPSPPRRSRSTPPTRRRSRTTTPIELHASMAVWEGETAHRPHRHAASHRLPQLASPRRCNAEGEGAHRLQVRRRRFRRQARRPRSTPSWRRWPRANSAGRSRSR